jgi:hypothetical protein
LSKQQDEGDKELILEHVNHVLVAQFVYAHCRRTPAAKSKEDMRRKVPPGLRKKFEGTHANDLKVCVCVVTLSVTLVLLCMFWLCEHVLMFTNRPEMLRITTGTHKWAYSSKRQHYHKYFEDATKTSCITTSMARKKVVTSEMNSLTPVLVINSQTMFTLVPWK